MKNYQQGFIGVAIAIIIALLAVGGGAYYLGTKKAEAPTQTATTTTTTTVTNTDQPYDDGLAPASQGTADESADWKIYTNTQYGFSLNYPEIYFAFEWPGLQKGERPVLVETTGNKGSVLFTTHDLRIEESWQYDYLSSPYFRITRENGSAWISGSNTIDDFWSKLGKTDEKGTVVNVFVKKESIGGVDFIIFNQKSWNTTAQSDLWSLQGIFMHNGNFFWVRPSPKLSQDDFYSILRSFKFN